MSKDLFSSIATGYARYRPGYPEALIQAILDVTPQKEKVWDCATGNGQAAIMLARHFEHVEATDLSAQQLQQATASEKITYTQCPAEKTPFEDDSFDCITVAQAYHWFNFDAFHKEATRVARNNATIAVWGYGLVKAPNPAIQKHIDELYSGNSLPEAGYPKAHQTDLSGAGLHFALRKRQVNAGPYWDPERKHIDREYRTVSFDFEELPYLNFEYKVEWTPPDLLGYLNTWSSLKNYQKANDHSPLDKWALELNTIWTAEKLPFVFPLFLRRGKIRK